MESNGCSLLRRKRSAQTIVTGALEVTHQSEGKPRQISSPLSNPKASALVEKPQAVEAPPDASTIQAQSEAALVDRDAVDTRFATRAAELLRLEFNEARGHEANSNPKQNDQTTAHEERAAAIIRALREYELSEAIPGPARGVGRQFLD